MLVDVEQLSEHACGLVAGKGGCRNVYITPMCRSVCGLFDGASCEFMYY